MGSLVGATIDKITLAQSYAVGEEALSFIESIVDTSAALCVFYDEGAYVSHNLSQYDFTFCCYYPQIVTTSEKWKALRLRGGKLGNNAGTSMPDLHGGHTLIRITFSNNYRK